jgi:glutaminyl-peptide cyclotransferase
MRRPRGAREVTFVLFDGLRLPREATSDVPLWSDLRAAAKTVGAQAVFPDQTGTAIIDDHTPFLQAGVPAVDLIDLSYPGHSLQDGIDKLSPKAIDAVGETVIELVARLRRQ